MRQNNNTHLSFNKDMTMHQFIRALSDYNDSILRRVYENQDYSDLITEFRASGILEEERYKEAFDIFNMTQPEIFFAGINVTPEVYLALKEPDSRLQPEFANIGPSAIEKKQKELYASLFSQYGKKHLDEYTKEQTSFDALEAIDELRPSEKKSLAKKLADYRKICMKWRIPNFFDDEDKMAEDISAPSASDYEQYYKKYRDSSLSDIQYDLYTNIRELLHLRCDLTFRYRLDVARTSNTSSAMDSDIYDLVQELENLDTFSERYNLLFKQKRTNSFKKCIDPDRYLILPYDFKGDTIGRFIEKTLKSKGTLYKKYRSPSAIFEMSEVSRNIIIAIFFYLCLPFEEFKPFLNYHGYSVTDELPLIVGRKSINKRNNTYKEKANIFYRDIENLYDAGLSFNTLLVCLFGKSVYNDEDFE